MQPGLLQLINPAEPKYPYDVHYIKEDEAFCSSVTNLTFLVIVLSSTTNFNRRQTLRKTWANESLYTSYGTLKIVSLLGITDKAKVQKQIDEEFNLYGDTVQGAFLDTYENLTHKSTMGFKWATERCRNAKYIIKTDDDVVINMFELFQNNKLSESENKTHVLCHRQSTRVLRDESEKWFVDHYQFKGMSRLPPYCGGLFVMILNEVVPYLYESVSKTPFFWLPLLLVYIARFSLDACIYSKKDQSVYTGCPEWHVYLARMVCILMTLKMACLYITGTKFACLYPKDIHRGLYEKPRLPVDIPKISIVAFSIPLDTLGAQSLYQVYH
ncbi:UDP-GalNAc:beta-1,3-N-acetylgalactosaminyltransferase 1-like [Mercenaria mercenaria]|uniref:UDP-GalNAc:beta-1, 3-N-acetylgalactosaminyltransferase 1-like n=1 Tax=Mercenaria mercenaria TaxID=6596 RepID=UPI00234F9C9F|nr:UDP-GalNAc:beta-1,3-N-acetylgalactosaminyltransferase 1-like [Mercenaria mercenaria]